MTAGFFLCQACLMCIVANIKQEPLFLLLSLTAIGHEGWERRGEHAA